MAINVKLLRIELVKREMTMFDLAKSLNNKSSTLSAWLREVNPQPADLGERIERVLGLQAGALAE